MPQFTAGTFSSAGPFQKLPVSTAAVALSVPGTARVAYIQCETADIRWRDDGTDPTATTGMILKAGGELPEFNGDLNKFRAIRAGGADGQLNVSFYR